jgi:hypothetical protein
MSTCVETLHRIIDAEADFFATHGTPPRLIRLPVLMAYDLAKCGFNDVGELSARLFREGISLLEREGLHGMKVELVRDRNAELQLE